MSRLTQPQLHMNLLALIVHCCMRPPHPESLATIQALSFNRALLLQPSSLTLVFVGTKSTRHMMPST